MQFHLVHELPGFTSSLNELYFIQPTINCGDRTRALHIRLNEPPVSNIKYLVTTSVMIEPNNTYVKMIGLRFDRLHNIDYMNKLCVCVLYTLDSNEFWNSLYSNNTFTFIFVYCRYLDERCYQTVKGRFIVEIFVYLHHFLFGITEKFIKKSIYFRFFREYVENYLCLQSGYGGGVVAFTSVHKSIGIVILANVVHY